MMTARHLLATLAILALATVRCREDPAARAKAALDTGRAHLATFDGGALPAARAAFTSALGIAREAQATALEQDALLGLAQVAARVGHQREMKTWLEVLLDDPGLVARPEVQQEALLLVALVYERLGDHEAASKHAERTRALAGLRGDDVGVARADLVRATIAAHHDDYLQAIVVLRQVISTFERHTRHDLATSAWCEMASVETRLAHRALALRAIEAAVAHAEAQADPLPRALAASTHALVTIDLDRDYARGVQIYDRAIEAYEAAGHLYGLAYALDGSAVALSTLGREPGTVERHRRALKLRRELGSARGEAQTLTSLGETLTRFGRYDEAAAALDEAIERHHAYGDRYFEAYARFRRARVEESRARFEAALEHIRPALALSESQRARIASRRRRAYFSAQAQVRWSYDLSVSSAVQSSFRNRRPDRLLEALATSERTRARAFRELVLLA